MFRQATNSASNSPAASGTVTPGSFLNSNIFDHSNEQFQLTPNGRPGTAPNSASTPVQAGDSYFPSDERRPSVASSTGSKSSKSRYRGFFGGGSGGTEPANESPGSSESSLPPNVTPRTHHGFARPNTPTSSRPRTPVPSADVVPFLYQDPEDIRRMGNAPVHETPMFDKTWRDEQDSSTAGSSHSHRLNLRGRHKERKELALDKELPPRPSVISLDSYGIPRDIKGGKLHLDGTASTGSSQVRLLRSASPTPSVASSLSYNAPRSPGDLPGKSKHKLWTKLGGLVGRDKEKAHDRDNEQGNVKRLRGKASEPMLNTSNPMPPISAGKRGSGGSENVHPRLFDYMPVGEIKKAGKGADPKLRVGRGKKHGNQQPEEVQPPLAIDMDFSNEVTFRNPGTAPNEVPQDRSWPKIDEPQAKERREQVGWEAPESWRTAWGVAQDTRGEAPDAERTPDEEQGTEDAQVGIYMWREPIGRLIWIQVLHTSIPRRLYICNTLVQAAGISHGSPRSAWA